MFRASLTGNENLICQQKLARLHRAVDAEKKGLYHYWIGRNRDSAHLVSRHLLWTKSLYLKYDALVHTDSRPSSSFGISPPSFPRLIFVAEVLLCHFSILAFATEM